MKNWARNFSPTSSHKLQGIHSLWEMVRPLRVSLYRQTGSAAFHNFLALKPVMSSVQRMCILSPHRLSVSWLRGIYRGLKFWLTLCNGCSVATGRILIPWAIKSSLFRSGCVTWRESCSVRKVPDLEVLETDGLYCVEQQYYFPFPSLWNANPLLLKNKVIHDVHCIWDFS